MSGFGNLFSDLLKGMGGQGQGQGQQGQAQGQDVTALLMQLLGNSKFGNFGGLLAQLQNGGLDKQVASWLGNGSNMPVSPDQLRHAMGGSNVKEMSQQSGLPTDDLLSMLSKFLPGLIDGMSPNGKLQEPESDEAEEPRGGGSLADRAGVKDIR